MRWTPCAAALASSLVGACVTSSNPGGPEQTCSPSETSERAVLPLEKVADVELPGAAVRFDYQEVDPVHQQLVVAHMNDAAVDIINLGDGTVKKRLTGIPRARGVAVSQTPPRIFATSSPNQLVIIDAVSLTELSRVQAGDGPDGVAFDPDDQIVGVSDQRDGAISLIADAGNGSRTQVELGSETGNVLYDGGRHRFWITVVGPHPDQLMAVDPIRGTVTDRIGLPGCEGAHGMRLHPDGKSAYIACEENDMLIRVDLEGVHAHALAKTGAGPDVLSIDPGLNLLYVAGEGGDLTVIDLSKPCVAVIGHDQPGALAHTVSVDAATHRVFFPLPEGPNGRPILRIMRPQS